MGADEPDVAAEAEEADRPSLRAEAGIVDSQSARTTVAGGEQRGFDGGKKARGRKRHILVDTEGLLVEARAHSARVPNQDGIKRLPETARDRLPRLSYLWVDAGYRGRGKDWAEEALGVEVEVVNRSPKPPPEKVLRIWAREWFGEGRNVDLGKLPERPAFEKLPRRWVADLRVGLPQPAHVKGLRAAVLGGGGVRVRGHDAPHAQAVGVRLTFGARMPCVGGAPYPGVVPL